MRGRRFSKVRLLLIEDGSKTIAVFSQLANIMLVEGIFIGEAERPMADIIIHTR
jgi:hypothetical protein